MKTLSCFALLAIICARTAAAYAGGAAYSVVEDPNEKDYYICPPRLSPPGFHFAVNADVTRPTNGTLGASPIALRWQAPGLVRITFSPYDDDDDFGLELGPTPAGAWSVQSKKVEKLCRWVERLRTAFKTIDTALAGADSDRVLRLISVRLGDVILYCAGNAISGVWRDDHLTGQCPTGENEAKNEVTRCRVAYLKLLACLDQLDAEQILQPGTGERLAWDIGQSVEARFDYTLFFAFRLCSLYPPTYGKPASDARAQVDLLPGTVLRVDTVSRVVNNGVQAMPCSLTRLPLTRGAPTDDLCFDPFMLRMLPPTADSSPADRLVSLAATLAFSGRLEWPAKMAPLLDDREKQSQCLLLTANSLTSLNKLTFLAMGNAALPDGWPVATLPPASHWPGPCIKRRGESETTLAATGAETYTVEFPVTINREHQLVSLGTTVGQAIVGSGLTCGIGRLPHFQMSRWWRGKLVSVRFPVPHRDLGENVPDAFPGLWHANQSQPLLELGLPGVLNLPLLPGDVIQTEGRPRQ